MAERTDEHLSMFEENKEAVYFSSKEELLEKCKYYLVHDSERKSIALAGRKRCITSGYSNEGMIRSAFKLIYNKKDSNMLQIKNGDIVSFLLLLLLNLYYGHH